MLLLAGLGNPGDRYKNTRHNIGFTVLDAYAKELGLTWEFSKKFKAEIIVSPLAKGGKGGFILAKPQTFMNLSGDSVQAILSYYNITAPALTVIHDDLDIDFGKYKISIDSRSAGHNGAQSIIDRLGTKNFRRIRIGIRTPEKEVIPVEKFVLMKFGKEEKKVIKTLLPKILEELKKA